MFLFSSAKSQFIKFVVTQFSRDKNQETVKANTEI